MTLILIWLFELPWLLSSDTKLFKIRASVKKQNIVASEANFGTISEMQTTTPKHLAQWKKVYFPGFKK
jgi:hypothetical protein